MIKGIAGIIDLLGSIVMFVIDQISALIMFLLSVGRSVILINSLQAYIPVYLYMFVSAGMLVAVILLLVNRN